MLNTKRHMRMLLLLMCLAMGAFPTTGQQVFADSQSDASAAVKLTDVVIGFDGHFKVGYWTPVSLTVVNSGDSVTGSLELETVDGDAVITRYASSEDSGIEVLAQQRKGITVYAKFGRVTGGLTLRLRKQDQVLAETMIAFDDNLRPAASTSELIVTVGDDIGISDGLNLRQAESGGDETTHAILDPAKHRFPDHQMGYESVDTLVFATSNVGLRGSRILAVQLEAIEKWVRLGGRLILCVDEKGHGLLEGSGVLASLVPGEFDRTAEFTNAAGLESYVGATQPLSLRGSGVMIAVLKNVRGTVEASERIDAQIQPTIIRAAHGFGHVTFVAMNLNAPAFRRWVDRPRLTANLLSRIAGRQQQAESEFRSGRASHLGYQDMAGQLRAAMDQFEGVRPLAFSAIAALIFVYILLIGPGDYFFLKKVARRMEWTWLSFVVIVAGFCGLIFLLVRATQSDEIHINYVEVIDIDAEAKVVRGTAWAHVYSPTTSRYDLTFSARLPLAGTSHDVLLSWNGLPGSGLGGMDTPVPVVTSGDSYELRYQPGVNAIRSSMEQLPIHTSSSKALQARWWASLESVSPGQLHKDPRDGSLRGEFTNPLDTELTDCVVLFRNWAYRLDRRLAAGETVRVEDELVEKTIEGFLNDRRVVESQDVATPWNTSSPDIARIMEVMLFFKAAGGSEYTNLALDYQNFVDLSDQLEAGRAIVFGRVRKRFGQLEDHGRPMDDTFDQQRQWTFVRIVLPVESR